MQKAAIIASFFAVASPAAANVSVWPQQSATGAREKYEIRVPNEKQADTTSIELRFPAGVRVTSFEQKPGWMTEAVRDGSGKIVGVRWTGKLPPSQFAEFGLLAVNPAAGTLLEWTAIQAYADGGKIEWSGKPGSKTPAARVTLVPNTGAVARR
jgi:uncharacterized protein YcnI